MSKIILASASPRRKELLAKAGISFTVIPAAGEEKRTSEDPGKLYSSWHVIKQSGSHSLWLNAKKELW